MFDMFKTARNGKIPPLKLEHALEHLHAEKPILPAEGLSPDWSAETGAFAFMYTVFRIWEGGQGMVGHKIDTIIVIKF